MAEESTAGLVAASVAADHDLRAVLQSHYQSAERDEVAHFRMRRRLHVVVVDQDVAVVGVELVGGSVRQVGRTGNAGRCADEEDLSVNEACRGLVDRHLRACAAVRGLVLRDHFAGGGGDHRGGRVDAAGSAAECCEADSEGATHVANFADLDLPQHRRVVGRTKGEERRLRRAQRGRRRGIAGAASETDYSRRSHHRDS